MKKIYQTFFFFYSKYQFQQRQKPIQVLNQFVGEIGEMVLRGFKGLHENCIHSNKGSHNDSKYKQAKRTHAIITKLSQTSPKSNPNSNLGLAGQHNWS